MELSKFWKGYQIANHNLVIDSDNLQGILIYIISHSNYPLIWIELQLIEEFLPQAVKETNR
jgi:hypothetical protein